MSRRFQTPVALKLDEDSHERVRRSHAECIVELQKVRVVGGKAVLDIELPDDTEVMVPHGLGRRAIVSISPARCSVSATPGKIREIRKSTVDPEKYVCLKANDWGETVTVDAWVY